MAAFPTISSVPYANPLDWDLRFKTILQEFANEAEQAKQANVFVRRDLRLVYKNITLAEAQTLWAFFLARKGRFEAFNFFWHYSASYTDEYVGTGDGSTTVFNLPCKTGSSLTYYVNDVEISSGITFGSATGTDGADKITFSTAPAEGDVITCDFTGYLKVRCRFEEDKANFKSFYNTILQSGLKLRGLLNA